MILDGILWMQDFKEYVITVMFKLIGLWVSRVEIMLGHLDSIQIKLILI